MLPSATFWGGGPPPGKVLRKGFLYLEILLVWGPGNGHSRDQSGVPGMINPGISSYCGNDHSRDHFLSRE